MERAPVGDAVESYVVQDSRLVGALFAGETRIAAQAQQVIRRSIELEQPFAFDAIRHQMLRPVRVGNPNR